MIRRSIPGYETIVAVSGLIAWNKIIKGTEYENLHLQFKKQNGYSQLEISQKRDALENVMRINEVETLETNLIKAGFTNIRIWFRCLNWVSILADK